MSTNLFDLNGKIALITGASRGIGESVARTLAAQGAHVIVSSRKLDGCELVASSIRNAATNPYFGPVEDTDMAAFNKTVDVNIRGYFFMCAKGAQLMKKHGGGAIVNVASVNGVNPGHFQGIYSITKAAVISMTKSFAMELGPKNIRVNALLPGLTDTKFASALTSNEAIKKQAMAHIPMKRVASPDEMAGTVLYLVSAASSYTTGACVNADGGYLTI